MATYLNSINNNVQQFLQSDTGVKLQGLVASNAELMKQTALSLDSKVREKAQEILREKIREEFGAEIFDMIQALGTTTDTLHEELGLAKKQFPFSASVPLVQIYHNTLPHVKTEGPLTNVAIVNEGAYWADFAAGAYGAVGIDSYDKAAVSVGIGEKNGVDVILASLPQKGVLLPGHFIAIDRNKRAVVLGVRGTTTLADAITDAVGEATEVPEMPGLKAHKAMMMSARAVLERTRAGLNEALQANPGYMLIVTGHSLGAGTAILCSLLLKAKPLAANPRLRCFAYAPPPVVHPLHAPAVKAVEIHAFVNRTDIVPRASLANVFHFGQEIMAVDQLQIPFFVRLQLIRRDAKAENPEEEQAKAEIMKAVKAVRDRRQAEGHVKFVPLLIPGEVYWIEWLDQPGSVQDSENSNAEGKPRIHRAEAENFQTILLRGGSNALKDHLIGGYQAGLNGYLLHLQANNGCNLSLCNCQ